jgi:hypothetical protein
MNTTQVPAKTNAIMVSPSKWSLESGAVVVMLVIASIVMSSIIFGVTFSIYKQYWKIKDKISRENYLFNLEANYQKAAKPHSTSVSQAMDRTTHLGLNLSIECDNQDEC